MTTETRRSIAFELLAAHFIVKEETPARLLVETKLTGANLWDFQDVASAVADLLDKEVAFSWNYATNLQVLKPTATPADAASKRVEQLRRQIGPLQAATEKLHRDVALYERVAMELQAATEKLHRDVALYERVAMELAPTAPEAPRYRVQEALRLGQERFEAAVRVYVSRSLFEGGELLLHLNREATLLWDPNSQLPIDTDQRTANRSLLQAMARKLARMHGAGSFTIRDNEDKFLIYDKVGK